MAVGMDHSSYRLGRGSAYLDKNFGPDNFKAKITWNTGDNISGFKSQALNWIRQADFIHFYSKGEKYPFWEGTVVGVDISLSETKEFSILLDLIREVYIKTIRERKKEKFKEPRFI